MDWLLAPRSIKSQICCLLGDFKVGLLLNIWFPQIRENPLKHLAMWAILLRDPGRLALMSSLVVWFHNFSKELCHHLDSLSFDLSVNRFGCQLANCLYLCTYRPTPYPVLPSFVHQETVIDYHWAPLAPWILMGSANGTVGNTCGGQGKNEVGIYVPQVSPSGSVWLNCFSLQKPLLLLSSPLLCQQLISL